MQITVHQLNNSKTGNLDVADSVFAVDFNQALIHQALTAFMASARSGTKAQKTRSEVRGGGRKPWRQKGTGRARAGTIRSPLWRGGGVTFAARPRSYIQKLNKKMYRGAMRSIFSELLRQDRLVIIDEIDVKEPKTKLMLQQLEGLNLKEVLIVTAEISENLYLATRNVPHINLIETHEVDPYVLMGFRKILMTKDAIEGIEAWLK